MLVKAGPGVIFVLGFAIKKWRNGKGEGGNWIVETDFNKSVCVLVRLDNKNNMGYIFVTCALRVYPNSNMDKCPVIYEIYTSYLLTKNAI